MVTTTSLNAADYGLIAGSSADQSSQLQAAINDAALTKKPLFVPPGTYKIIEVLISQPVEIYAQRAQAVFKPFSSSDSCRFTIAPTSGRLGPVTIRGIAIDGDGATFPGTVPFPGLINANACDQLLIEECRLTDSSDVGVYLNDVSGIVRNNECNSHSNFGIFSNNAVALSVLFNDLNFNSNNGIAVWRDSPGGDTSIIHGNRIAGTDAAAGGTGQNGNAIQGYRAYHMIITDNVMINSAFSAVRLNSCSYCQIANNQCYGSTETAIFVEAPDNATDPDIIYQGGVVTGNEINVCGTGISVTNVDAGGRRVVVSNNQVTDSTDNTITYSGGSYQTHGGGIFGEGDVLIISNMIESTDGFGITAFPTNVNQTKLGTQKIVSRIADNVLKSCPGGIALVNGDTTYGRFLVSGNMVTGYATSGSVSGAIVPATYNGSTYAVARTGTADFGNATVTPSGYPNIVLTRSYSFN